MRRELAGLAAGVALLAAMLLLLDVERVARNLARARPPPLVAALVSGLAGVGLLGLALGRLRRALEPDAERAPLRFFGAFLRAYFVRLLIPIGSSGAPAIYAYVLHREFDSEFEEELAVGTAAELLNYGASAGVALVGVAAFALGGGQLAYSGTVTLGVGLIFAGVFGAFVLLWSAPGALDRAVLGLSSLINRSLGQLSTRVGQATARRAVRTRLQRFHRTTALLRAEPRTMGLCAGLTTLAWLALSAPLLLVVRSLGGSVPIALVLIAVPVSGFMYVLPVSGGLGGVEAAIGTLLVAGGLPVPLAAAAVLLHRVATYWVPLLVAGLATAASPGVGVSVP